MKVEQVPGKPPRFPPPAAANIARAVHNLIICVLIAAQVSSSSKPPTTRVAIIRGLHIAANSGFEGAPCHNISCILPRYLPRTLPQHLLSSATIPPLD